MDRAQGYEITQHHTAKEKRTMLFLFSQESGSEGPYEIQVKCRVVQKVHSPEEQKQRDGECLGADEKQELLCCFREGVERVWNYHPHVGEETERTTAQRWMDPGWEEDNICLQF